MNLRNFILLACIFAGASPVRSNAAESESGGYKVVRTMHVGGMGRWDYVTLDNAGKRLFVTRSDHTQVLDCSDGHVLAEISDTPSSHGVALAEDAGRGFISDGHGVTVFDLKTLKPLGTIEAGKGSDAIIYDPASKCVVVMNGRSNDASFIDAGAEIGSAKATNVPLGGRPEFAAADGNGRVFINLEDKSEIAVLDSAAKKVVETWKIDGGEGPSGLALDVEGHRLFAGCHNKVMAVVDSQTGKTLGTVPIGSGVDACAFNPQTKEAFASCGDETLTVIKESSPGKFEATQTVKTPRGARTMALDPATQTLYLPTAEFEPAQPGQRRPTAKPDTFMIVVVAPAK
jgi:DNA-binding beta-propeller fold protein YncE